MKTEVIISRAKDHSPLYTKEKVCEWLGIDEPTLNLWIEEGAIVSEDTVLPISLFNFESIIRVAREKNRYKELLSIYSQEIHKVSSLEGN